MSVIIVFPDGADWFKANWVFRQLAQDVSDRYGSDAEVRKAVEAAEALGALDLKEMSDGLRKRVMEALSAVATDTIEAPSLGGDRTTRRSTHFIARRFRNCRNALKAKTTSARNQVNWRNIPITRIDSIKRLSGQSVEAVPGFENERIAMEGLAHELFTRSDSA